MDARLKPGVRTRADIFGGVCYVPHRDDFFAANKEVFRAVKMLSGEWVPIEPAWQRTFVALAKLGICETREPNTLEIAYSGPSFLGKFPEIATVEDPLVLNCFATAHCPLKCAYCHADDLMQSHRDQESEQDLDNVASTASMINSMVAVITGGDPLTKPERARRLIERLAGQKSLVLDTSGVGDLEILLPTIKAHDVHVRVSLDAISQANDKVRPRNPNYVKQIDASSRGATRTIERCVAEGVPVTVQSVVSSVNENESEWRHLRDWMVERGVRHWVLHVAVRGGSARRIENETRKHKRRRGILPGEEVYEKLKALIDESSKDRIALDIRCTDTANTPNSVLLIGSEGDLYTEGYAHDGKVLLFRAGDARPDRLRSLWPHVDRFGHARRYFNWNPYFYRGVSLENICYDVPIPAAPKADPAALVETESKHRVADPHLLRGLLERSGFTAMPTALQRDEYYDTRERAMEKLDFVVRLRLESERVQLGMKGPRFYAPEGEYSRIELEIDIASENSIRQELAKKRLECTWFFEKRRTEYKSSVYEAAVLLDEIPEAGYCLEIEGSLDTVRRITKLLLAALGAKERRNYKELFVAHQLERGVARDEIRGASFSGA